MSAEPRRTLRCDLCGRAGTLQFVILPAGEINGIHFDAVTRCKGRQACRRRQY